MQPLRTAAMKEMLGAKQDCPSNLFGPAQRWATPEQQRAEWKQALAEQRTLHECWLNSEAIPVHHLCDPLFRVQLCLGMHLPHSWEDMVADKIRTVLSQH